MVWGERAHEAGWPPEEQAVLEYLSGWVIGADFLRIAPDEQSKKAGMQRCRNVYRTAVNAYHCSGRADQADELRIKITGLSSVPRRLKTTRGCPQFLNRRGLSPVEKIPKVCPHFTGVQGKFWGMGCVPRKTMSIRSPTLLKAGRRLEGGKKVSCGFCWASFGETRGLSPK